MADAIGYMLSPHPRLDPIPKDVGTSMVWNRTTVERWKVGRICEHNADSPIMPIKKKSKRPFRCSLQLDYISLSAYSDYRYNEHSQNFLCPGQRELSGCFILFDMLE
jgi:hypothetical protein